MPNDVEEQVIDSNIDNDLRNEISQAKEPSKLINKKWIYIGAAVLGVIVIGLLVYFLAFANSKSTFTFYLNNTPVTENLNVKITFDGITDEFVTTGSTLIIPSYPKDEKFTVEVTSYNFKKDFIGGLEEYRVDIKKIFELADNTSKPISVSFSVYSSNDSFNVYSGPVTLSLKCLTSGKTDSIIVNGSSSYSKDSDCGALQINANVSGFTPYSSTCSEMYCSIKLSELISSPPAMTKNNLIIYAIDKENQDPLKDVNVTVTRYGFTQTLKTDSVGKVEFVDLETGQYTVSGNVLYDGTNFSKTEIVSVIADVLAITKTLEFNFSNTNKISLLIDANKDLECQFVVEIFDKTSKSVFPGDVSSDDYPIFDANIKHEISFDDLNTSSYYMTVAPIDEECVYIYAPIYNREFKYPENEDMIVKMLPFDKNAMVFLSVDLKPNYSGVSIKIREADNNRYILNDMSPFILYQDKNYVVVGESDFGYGSVNYKYSKKTAGHTPNEDGYYYDSVILPMKIGEVDVKLYADIFNDMNTPFIVEANWIDQVGNSKSLVFDGEQNLAELGLPAGTDVLLKVSKQVTPIIADDTYTLNYYLNKFRFALDSTNNDINVFLTDEYVTDEFLFSIDRFPHSRILNRGYYTDPMLKNIVKDNNLSGNKDYYIPIDVVPRNIKNDCVSGNKEGMGFLFSVGAPLGLLDINDIFAYSFNPISHSNIGFDFKPVFVEKTAQENEINIFRVVIDARVRDVIRGSGNIDYDVTQDSISRVLAEQIDDFTINGKLQGTSENIYLMDLNLFGKADTKVNLPIDEKIGAKIKHNIDYSVFDVNWFGRSASVCDPFSDISQYIDDLNLTTPFIGQSIDENGVLDVTLDPSNTLKDYDIPIRLDLRLQTTIVQNDDINKKASYNLPITLRLNRLDHPQSDCLSIVLNDGVKRTKLRSKNILTNDIILMYYNGESILHDYITQSDLNDNQKAAIISSYNNLESNSFWFLFNSYLSNLFAISGYQGSFMKIFGVNYDLIFNNPKSASFSNNNCPMWDFTIGYGSLTNSLNELTYYPNEIKDPNVFSPQRHVISLSQDINNIQFYSFYKNKYGDNPDETKVHSSSFAFIPKPITDKLKLSSDFKSMNDIGTIIPLETNENSPDCTTKMCGRYMFDIWLKKHSGSTNKVYLMDDNYIGLGEFEGVGLYEIKDNKINGIQVGNDELVYDQLFYHLPIKYGNLFEPQDLIYGTCVSEGAFKLYYENKDYLECNPQANGKVDGYINLKAYYEYNAFKDNLISSNNYNKYSTALIGKLNNTDLNVYTTAGFKYKICGQNVDITDCILEDNNNDFISGNSKYNAKYFIMVGRNYYLPNQMFLNIGGQLYPRIDNYSLITMVDDKQSIPTQMDRNFGLGGQYDMSKFLSHFNNGDILSIIDSRSRMYYYNWNVDNIFKGLTIPIVFTNLSRLIVKEARSYIVNQTGDRNNNPLILVPSEPKVINTSEPLARTTNTTR